MSVKLIPRVTCDVCGREELDPPASWKTFDIALLDIGWRPVVNLCDSCTSIPIGELITKLEAKYGGAPCPR